MPYTKTIWVDRDVQFPNRFQKVNENSTSVELVPMEGTILQAGTDITAELLNKMEQGIYDADSNATNAINATTGLQTQINAIVGVKTATITTTWTGASAPFTQVVNVTGVTANDEPIISPIYSTTNATAILERTAWNLIGSAVTGAGTITFTCFETKPTTAITVQIKGV